MIYKEIQFLDLIQMLAPSVPYAHRKDRQLNQVLVQDVVVKDVVFVK